MFDFSRSGLWRGVIDASLSLFDVLEEAIDPASWPPGWELHYTDRAPEPRVLSQGSG
jgi:hypothetical protein